MRSMDEFQVYYTVQPSLPETICRVGSILVCTSLARSICNNRALIKMAADRHKID